MYAKKLYHSFPNKFYLEYQIVNKVAIFKVHLSLSPIVYKITGSVYTENIDKYIKTNISRKELFVMLSFLN